MIMEEIRIRFALRDRDGGIRDSGLFATIRFDSAYAALDSFEEGCEIIVDEVYE